MYLLPGDSGIVHIVIISLLQLKASASRAVPAAEPVSMHCLGVWADGFGCSCKYYIILYIDKTVTIDKMLRYLLLIYFITKLLVDYD